MDNGIANAISIAGVATARGRQPYQTVINRTSHFTDSAVFDKRVSAQGMTFTDEQHKIAALKSGDLSRVQMGAISDDQLTFRSGLTLHDRPWHRTAYQAVDGSKGTLGFRTHVSMPEHHGAGMQTGNLVISNGRREQEIEANGVTTFRGFDSRIYYVNPDKSVVVLEQGGGPCRAGHAETGADGTITIRDYVFILAKLKPLLQQHLYITADMQAPDKKYPTAADYNRE